MHSSNVLKAVCVTAELCGRTFTEPAAMVFCSDLEAYPEVAILSALARCRREVRGMLTTQDVVSRMDDGRPGVEQAWAMTPAGEDDTVVWTTEMAEAHAACAPLIEAGDKIGARMTFKEVYSKLVTKAVAEARPVEWVASLGWDLEKRKRVLLAAVKEGKLPALTARDECPALPLTTGEKLALPAPNPVRRENYRQKVTALARAKSDPNAEHPDPLAWARDLKARDKAGEELTAGQRDAWKRALHHRSDDGALFQGFAEIPDHILPPAMRKQRPEPSDAVEAAALAWERQP